MTAPHILNPAAVLDNALSGASPDLMRNLLTTVINALLSAEADAVCGAEYGQPSPERVNSRNGYRHRELDTRAGTIDVAVPKLRSGSYFPEWLLERRKRAEAALISVVATCYLLGVSTRRVDKLVQTLGITSLSKSQASRMAADLDEQVAAFRTRPLGEAGPFTFVAADAFPCSSHPAHAAVSAQRVGPSRSGSHVGSAAPCAADFGRPRNKRRSCVGTGAAAREPSLCGAHGIHRGTRRSTRRPTCPHPHRHPGDGGRRVNRDVFVAQSDGEARNAGRFTMPTGMKLCELVGAIANLYNLQDYEDGTHMSSDADEYDLFAWHLQRLPGTARLAQVPRPGVVLAVHRGAHADDGDPESDT